MWALFSQLACMHATLDAYVAAPRAPTSCAPRWGPAPNAAGYEVVATRAWTAPGAYPAFDPPEDFAPFTLAPGLFYAAALENAASAMGAPRWRGSGGGGAPRAAGGRLRRRLAPRPAEIAAIEGRMTALLAAEHLARRGAAALDAHSGGGVLQSGGGGSSEAAAAA